MLNVYMKFEDALKLNIAVQECVRRLNNNNRATAAGRGMGLNIVVHLEGRRISINETPL